MTCGHAPLREASRIVIRTLDRGRMHPFPSSGGAKPIAARRYAAWGGLEGFTPPHNLRRGQRLSTDIRLPPAPRVSARFRFAVIALSKAMDVGRDHLIHRKRSPFPYEGKALTPLKVGEYSDSERYNSHFQTYSRIGAERSAKGSGSDVHPPRSGPPSPQGEGQEHALSWATLHLSGAPVPGHWSLVTCHFLYHGFRICRRSFDRISDIRK